MCSRTTLKRLSRSILQPFVINFSRFPCLVGAVHSPQILMLSGIGPKHHLKEHGIQCKVDSPAVGKNLQVCLACSKKETLCFTQATFIVSMICAKVLYRYCKFAYTSVARPWCGCLKLVREGVLTIRLLVSSVARVTR